MLAILIVLLAVIWSIAGITAFISSIVCLFYKGSIGDKLIGLVISMFLGPLYWLFYIYNLNYCTKL
jgi:hypothetical protein